MFNIIFYYDIHFNKIFNGIYIVEETEVFRLDSKSAPPNNFDKTKCYAFALYSRKEGEWPNERYYTSHPLQYLGKHVRSEEWSSGHHHGGAEIFVHDGKETRIVFDYDGKTCFKIVPCFSEGGNIKRRSRKMKKKVKKSRRHNI
jgi:hypothetical protein